MQEPSLYDMFRALVSCASADIKGALMGGVVSLILDKGSKTRRFFNGLGSVIFSYATTNGLLEILGKSIPKTESVIILAASVLAIVGIAVAEILQRIVRRIIGHADEVVDTALEKYVGIATDKKDT